MLDELLHAELDPAFTKNTLPFIVQEYANDYDDPIVNFVNNILHDAILKTASDIHIEPYEHTCRIRYRQYGILRELTTVPSKLALRVVSRIKIMANLNISETRLPQDGRLQLHPINGPCIDIRVNTCPTLFGEKVVIRILDANRIALSISHLGMTSTQQNCFIEKISAPQGMILVTGPTGSGKTVTLYSALQFLNSSEKNISTIEDPIEIQLNGINQMNINPKIGLDFANCLRTLVRQDPDIIMVGEIRDAETASIAMQCAQTGHLVFSTLHANNATETLSRLESLLGKNHFLTPTLIIAQRLVRTLCPHCKKPAAHEEHIVFEASSCSQCIGGYTGRIGIYELLSPTEKFISLQEAALQTVYQGITSLQEMNRVIG